MSAKWNDSTLTVNELKNKLIWVPSVVEKKTKNMKKKIDDGSVVVIEKVKDMGEKAWKAIKEWKDYVVDKCKNLKSKLNSKQSKVNNKGENTLSELVEMNKELVELTKKLIDKYEENTKLINELSKKISPTKQKAKSEKISK